MQDHHILLYIHDDALQSKEHAKDALSKLNHDGLECKKVLHSSYGPVRAFGVDRIVFFLVVTVARVITAPIFSSNTSHYC